MLELSRRAFLQVTAGGAGAIAASMGIEQAGKLIPYVIPPEDTKPGVWATYATTCRECPAGCGMHIRHRDGRAQKAEGNPLSPVNTGTLCARGQASLQGLYDPDRLRQPQMRPNRDSDSAPATWAQAIGAVGQMLQREQRKVLLVSDLQTGALAEVMAAFAQSFGGHVVFYEPFNYQPLRDAHRSLLGQDAVPHYRLDRSRYILSFGAEFLETWVSPVEYARDFMQMHQVRPLAYGKDPYGNPAELKGRLVYVGPRLNMTAANADEYLQVDSGQEGWAALAVLNEVLRQGEVQGNRQQIAQAAKALGADQAARRSGLPAEAIARIAKEFATAQGAVALACPTAASSQTVTHACMAAALLNLAVGSIGSVVDFSQPHALSRTVRLEELSGLLEQAGKDAVILLHNANLAYSMPGGGMLANARSIVYLGHSNDETAAMADVILPTDYPLETWGDYEPYPGVHSLIQPTMARLFDTRNAGDILLAIAQSLDKSLQPRGAQQAPEDFLQWLQQRWQRQHEASDWKSALRAGGAFQEAGEDKTTDTQPATQPTLRTAQLSAPADAPKPEGDQFDLHLFASIFLFDGRLANRGWLQEAPEPIAQATWSNWAEIHPERAKSLKLQTGDVVEVASSTGQTQPKLLLPVLVTPDIAPATVAIMLGQGHTAMGAHARTVGVNAFSLRAGTEGDDGLIVRISRTGQHGSLHPTAVTQDQHHREVVQWAPPEQAIDKPGTLHDKHFRMPLPEGYREGLYQPHDHNKHRWAMVIDLQRCIGCGACAVACYAENNVPVVGPAEVDKGREMAWLKVVPYRQQNNPRRVGFIPMLCQQCDSAPCEPVCPVYAAVHNEDGLNAQVYNRCIGTRYCNNNCPYKVRRFNWFDHRWPEPSQWQLNPEVTVRGRGVMEKCTFCIQRIRQGQHRALRQDRPLRDGEIMPACAQTCPTMAIIFGDLHREDALVTRLIRNDPRRYQVLGELNAKPAVIYLRRVTGADKPPTD